MTLRSLIFSLALAAPACACTIPVFRFALDRWEADKFHLVLPAALSKDASVNALLRPLRANGKANLDITTTSDVTQPELRYSRESDHPVWTGALNADSLGALLDSPGRQELLKRILAGESVIWVTVTDKSDTAEAERIEKRLKFLEQVATLPVQNPNDPDSQLGPGPALRLKFTTLHLRRDDPAEQPLIQMLAGPTGKVDASKTNFAAAVFGRGRVLGAWPLSDLDDASLEDACMFLVGRCSCRVKNENPGWDILMNVDWEKALGAVKPALLATNAESVEATVPETSPLHHDTQPVTVTTKATPEAETSSSPPTQNRLPMLAGIAAAILGAFALMLFKSK